MKRIVTRIVGIFAVVTLAVGTIAAPAQAHAPGVVLPSGSGKPSVDGVMSSGEWQVAGYLDFTVNLPHGGTTSGRVFAMNDANNLYLAVRWARDHVDPSNSVIFEFDNDHSGAARANGDDALVYSFNNSPGSGLFVDDFRDAGGSGQIDSSDGGATNGSGAFGNDGTFTVVEISHPLDSMDHLHDFSIRPGDTLGFTLMTRMFDGPSFPSDYGDTWFPTPLFMNADLMGDLVTAPLRPLVGMWRFDGTTGDNSQYNNFGTRSPSSVTGPQFDLNGKFGSALRFDGTDDYFNVADNNNLDITDNLTIEAWVNLTDYTYPSSAIVSKDNANQRSYALFIGGNPVFPQYRKVGFVVSKDGRDFSVVVGRTDIILGRWYHIAGTYKYVADGTSEMKIFVDGVLDSLPKVDAGGPIFSGTANVQIGARQDASIRNFTKGMIDEVHIWNTPHPVYSLFVSPVFDADPVGGKHTVTATVRANTGDASVPKPAVPGVTVNWLFSPNSVNHPPTSPVMTNSSGNASLTYADTSAHGGFDSIAAWADQDWSGGAFDQDSDAFAIAGKGWVENFLTGGGKINIDDGKKAEWSFSGTVGVLPEGGVTGDFEIVDHITGVTYYSDNLSNLSFNGDNATSPNATHNAAHFTGNFTGDDGSWAQLRIDIYDLGEPGAGVDTIRVSQWFPPPPPLVWPPLSSPPPLRPGGIIWIGSSPDSTVAEPVVINGGNFQVHDLDSTSPGRIILTKQTNPDGAPDNHFVFTMSYGAQVGYPNGLQMFDGFQVDSGFVLAPGTYTITEWPTAGWTLTSIDINDPSGGSSSSGGVATISLAAGETVAVTYNNSKNP